MSSGVFPEQIWDSLHRMSSKMDAIIISCCEKQQLTASQSRVLFLLCMEARMSMSSLGHRLGIAPGNLSPLCKKMENAGLITRMRSQKDERVVEISLTPLGRERAMAFKKQMDDIFSKAMDALSPAEAEEIFTGIQRMEAMLEGISLKDF